MREDTTPRDAVQSVRDNLYAVGSNLYAFGCWSVPEKDAASAAFLGRYLIELSRREDFCCDLAATDLDPSLTAGEMAARLKPLVDRLSIPSLGDAGRDDLTALFAAARLGFCDCFPLPLEIPHRRIELQFIVSGDITAHADPSQPVIEAERLDVPPRRADARRRLSAVSRQALIRLIRRIREVANDGHLEILSVQLLDSPLNNVCQYRKSSTVCLILALVQ